MGMVGGEDWLFRPVRYRYCQAESIFNSTLNLEAIDMLNEMIDVELENARRLTPP